LEIIMATKPTQLMQTTPATNNGKPEPYVVVMGRYLMPADAALKLLDLFLHGESQIVERSWGAKGVEPRFKILPPDNGSVSEALSLYQVSTAEYAQMQLLLQEGNS